MLDIPGIEYFKKNTWCGSFQNKRCRIAVSDDKFVVTVWNGPYSFEVTSDEYKINTEFKYTKSGLDSVNQFLTTELL